MAVFFTDFFLAGVQAKNLPAHYYKKYSIRCGQLPAFVSKRGVGNWSEVCDNTEGIVEIGISR
jgi:hypothetical protein